MQLKYVLYKDFVGVIHLKGLPKDQKRYLLKSYVEAYPSAWITA